jgi:hypothetical protein
MRQKRSFVVHSFDPSAEPKAAIRWLLTARPNASENLIKIVSVAAPSCLRNFKARGGYC